MDHDMTFRNTALPLLARVQGCLSHIELVHIPHPAWPLPPQATIPRPIRMAILDSSFNPPTLAHLALINASIPSSDNIEGVEADYDARLLLLSVKNADKVLKATDATYIQRLQMMCLLSRHIRSSTSPNLEPANVAIGITNEPTFVRKSMCLLSFLRNRIASLSSTEIPQLELAFIIGIDTLERLVAPRYYDSEKSMLASLNRFLSPKEDNCVVVCARRNLATFTSVADKGVESVGEDGIQDSLKPARQFIHSGRIKFMDIGADESTFSSTTVRGFVKDFGITEQGRKLWGRFMAQSVAEFIVSERLYLDE